MAEEAWLDHALWDASIEIAHCGVETTAAPPPPPPPTAALHIFLPCSFHAELTSTVVRLIPNLGNIVHSSGGHDTIHVRLHPLLYEFLSLTTQRVQRLPKNIEHNNRNLNVVISPMDGFNTLVANASSNQIELCAQTIRTVLDLPVDAQVILQCIHDYRDNCTINDDIDQDSVAKALQGRWLLQGTTQILCLTPEVHIVVTICAIRTTIPSSSSSSSEDVCCCYQIGPPGSYSLMIVEGSLESSKRRNDPDSSSDILFDSEAEFPVHCPGYDTLVNQLVNTLQLSVARPTGIVLTGSNGVGKTRLAQSVSSCLLQSRMWKIHWVSVHNLILQASWATEEDLVGALQPPTTHKPGENVLLIIDDLDSAGNNDSDNNASHPNECQLVRSALLQGVQQMVVYGIPILGIGTEISQLPSELLKVGRLEKEIVMSPPSQSQREQILENILETICCNDSCRHEWVPVLAILTQGCVAGDLKRLCADAWNRALARRDEDIDLSDPIYDDTSKVDIHWDDLTEAARNCLPSQLAALDVTKPKSYLSECSSNDWARIHELCFSEFAGYAHMKKRLYRTVVMPWRRFLANRDSSVSHDTSKTTFIVPPSGVIFHGPSGCGKTFAGHCLASAVGLSMIKVRAADVLDKWLGGSEAAIRAFFQRARAAAPSILFFDEMDAIAGNRSNDGESGDVMSRLLSTLLNEMDGISNGPTNSVLVMACTNRLQSLDAALLRPGRLEESISLELPILEDVKLILSMCLSRVPLDDTFDLDQVASEFVSKATSSAIIDGTCREAVLLAIRRCPMDDITKMSVTSNDMRDAMKTMKVI